MPHTKALVIIAVIITLLSLPSTAFANDEGDFVSRINTSRAAAGLPAVSVDGGLARAADVHSAAMLAGGAIYHSSNLASGAPSGWSALAENVGAGPSVESLHAAFMASAGHRRNIMGDYNYVGVGVVRSESGQVWVTVRFARAPSAAPAPTTSTTTSTTSTTTAGPVPVSAVAAPPVTAPAAASVRPATTRRGFLRVGRALHLPIAD